VRRTTLRFAAAATTSVWQLKSSLEFRAKLCSSALACRLLIYISVSVSFVFAAAAAAAAATAVQQVHSP